MRSARANFTAANALLSKYFYFITNKYSYFQDMFLGAESQETAAESYVYGHIDAIKGEELNNEAVFQFQEILDGATDPQTLQMTGNALTEATKFEARVLASESCFTSCR